MADSAADIPGRYDILIDGHGYIIDRTWNPDSLRHPPTSYEYTATFVERTNTSGNYGDDQQAFWLTASQNDFTLGEGRRFFRSADKDGVRAYWTATNADPVSIPGQVTIRKTTPSLSFANAVLACTEYSGGVYATSSANLYHIDNTGAITSDGAHGLGAAPSQWGLTGDSSNIFLSTTAGGTVGVRKWSGASFTTFSATGSDSLAYLGNTLYGYQESTGQLIRYDTSGNASSLFTWRDGAGAALTGSTYRTRLRPYGGQLLVLRTQGFRRAGELWQYDGTGTSELGDFPANFVAKDMEIISGIAFVSGYISRNADVLPAIFFYVSGRLEELWRANVSGYTNTTWPAMAAYGEGIIFTDDTTGKLMQYDFTNGGVHTVGSYTVTNATPMMAANKDVVLHTRNSTTAYYFPSSTTNTTATIVTSLIDFDNSMLKFPRGVRVEFDAASDGNGGSVDIAYQFESSTGAFTTLQTGAVSGTEYTLPSTSAHSVSLKFTLNKGTSTNGPAFKRYYLRAAPVLPAYRLARVIIDCRGVDAGVNSGAGGNTLKLRDDTYHTLTGFQMATNLRASAVAAAPISVTDEFGTYTAVFETANFQLEQLDPQEFRAFVTLREV